MKIYRVNDLPDDYKGLRTDDDVFKILNESLNSSISANDALFNQLFYFDYIRERRKIPDMIKVCATCCFAVKEPIKKVLESKLQKSVEFIPITVEENEDENFYFLKLKSTLIAAEKNGLNEYSFKTGIQFPLCFNIQYYEGITEFGFFCNQEMKDYIEQNNIKGVEFEEIKYSLI